MICKTAKSKAVSRLSKKYKFVESEKSKKSKSHYKFVLWKGRLRRLRVYDDDKFFKTDNCNSFASKRKIQIRMGTRPQLYRKAPEPSFSLYNQNREIFHANEVDLDKAVIVDGCFDTNKVILQRTATPAVEDEKVLSFPDEYSITKFRKAIKATVRKMKVEKVFSPNFDHCGNCKFNKNTKPGFSSEFILGNKTKEESSEASYEAARVIWNSIERKARKVKRKGVHNSLDERLEELRNEFYERDVPGKGLYDIGARAKRDVDYEEAEDATSRAIHMPEFHNEIVMAPWIDSITDVMKNRSSGPIYIGNSISEFVRFERDIKGHKTFAEGDWKRFDSTLYLRICLIAISILRSFYDLDDVRADAFFHFIAERICIKDYYMPGGRIVRMIHGLPSGTKCTNLLGSIINLLCLNYCIEPFDNKKFSFAVGGDDFVILSKVNLSEDMLEEVKRRSIDLGMEFKFLDLKYKNSNNLNELPYFYKYSVRAGKPVLKPADMFWRILVPWNKKYDNSLKYIKFLEDQIPLLGSPNASHIVFYSMYVNMHRRIHKNSSMTIERIYKIHKSSFEKYSSKLFYKSRRIEKDVINTFLKNYNSEQVLSKVDKLLCRIDEKETEFIEFRR